MTAFVVETNVAITANDQQLTTPQADIACIRACIQSLQQCMKFLRGQAAGKVVVDAEGEIEREYGRHLNRRGQPGVGDEFFFEVCQQAHGNGCERVPNTISFPSGPDLAGFDKDDRKFVTTALGSQFNPVVLNAVDSDWLHYQTPLKLAGVRIQQLCPQCLKP